MTAILGIDCSSKSFAYTVMVDGKIVDYGKLSFGPKDIFYRLGVANRVVREKFEGYEVDFDEVVFEGAVVMNSMKTVTVLSYSLGAAISPLINDDIKVSQVMPITWQNFIGNKKFNKDQKSEMLKLNPGRAKSWYSNEERKQRKQLTIEWVEREFGLKITDDDIADSIGVAYYRSKNPL